jgi:hypothetical protein
MPLTPAERMAGTAGDCAMFIHQLKEILQDWPDTVKLTDNRNRRFQSLGQIVYAIESLPDINIASVLTLEKWIRGPSQVRYPEEIKHDIQIMVEIARDHYDIAFKNSIKPILAPIEFVFAAILVQMFKNSLGVKQLACAIQLMRMFVRARHDDIRTNARVSRTLKTFLVIQMEEEILHDRLGEYQQNSYRHKRRRSFDNQKDGEESHRQQMRSQSSYDSGSPASTSYITATADTGHL